LTEPVSGPNRNRRQTRGESTVFPPIAPFQFVRQWLKIRRFGPAGG